MVRSCRGAPGKVRKTIFNSCKIRSLSAVVPWYCRSSGIERDFRGKSVNTEMAKFAVVHKDRLINHISEEVYNLIEIDGLVRKLRCTKSSDLIPP